MATASFAAVPARIFPADPGVPLDSSLAAIGASEPIPVMSVALCIAIGLMRLPAEPVAAFIQRHPAIRMRALAFLRLIGGPSAAAGQPGRASVMDRFDRGALWRESG